MVRVEIPVNRKPSSAFTLVLGEYPFKLDKQVVVAVFVIAVFVVVVLVFEVKIFIYCNWH